ncbi:integrase arm-type DNA-binding domain-containing protein [Ferrimonas balearica]|uniref:integrase arm-type DNA-binding domain-containing protein n=1 Tax=Ferrimonas balearica TaxID=44012 RepID=UPI001C99E26C|nr:integrase arm-type DNA-binding domain-containing protein [Ferrimonas balearica]MBY5991536.1 integrase family protein [Ferrimonas balearica]
MVKLTPKQQVLLLLDEALATGVRGRVASILKQAKSEIEGKPAADDGFYHQAASDISDPDRPGLVFKVGKHSRRWIYRYTPKGAKSTKQLTLGHFPEMGVEQARQAWAEAKAERAGQAPVQPKAPEGPSVADLVGQYLDYAKDHRSQWRQERKILEGALWEQYGEWPAEQLAGDHIRLLLSQVQEQAQSRGGHGKRAAEHALTTYRHLFNVARGLTEPRANGVPWICARVANPCEGLVVPRAVSVERAITQSEVGQYLKALIRLPINEELKQVLMLQLALLVPLSALCRLRWQGVDWRLGRVVVEDRQGQVRTFPLTAQAVELLQNRKRKADASDWVFPALKHKERALPVSYPTQMLAAIRQHISLPDQFTSEAICRLGREWVRQDSPLPVMRLPIREEQGSELQLVAIKEQLEQWNRYLASLRQSV